jgi:hypothetical protein
MAASWSEWVQTRPGRTAYYLLIDALRYEMGIDLGRHNWTARRILPSNQ